MDRFRFRIFDKKHKQLTKNFTKIVFDYENEVVRILCKKAEHWLDIPMSECTVQQCTGLKDKDGNLIFEGDIVEYINEEEAFCGDEEILNCKFVVKWSGWQACFFFDGLSRDEEYEFNCTCDEPKNVFKIIGNIFANPELLEKAEG